LIAYKNVVDNMPLSETQENLINWYITKVIPIVHVLSRAKDNWRPFAIVSGAYSTFVTLSDEAFALFLIKHYRSPPSAKSIRAFKINKFIKIEKQDNASGKNKKTMKIKMMTKKKRMATMTKRMKMIKIMRRVTMRRITTMMIYKESQKRERKFTRKKLTSSKARKISKIG